MLCKLMVSAWNQLEMLNWTSMLPQNISWTIQMSDDIISLSNRLIHYIVNGHAVVCCMWLVTYDGSLDKGWPRNLDKHWFRFLALFKSLSSALMIVFMKANSYHGPQTSNHQTVTIRGSYSSPRSNACFDLLGKAVIFLLLDANST